MSAGTLTGEKLFVGKGCFSNYPVIFIINIIKILIGRNEPWKYKAGYGIFICFTDKGNKLYF